MSHRGIQLSDRGKGKRRAELLELCQNEAKMKQQKLEEVVESFDQLLEEKLQTNQGLLPNSWYITFLVSQFYEYTWIHICWLI